MIYANRGVIRPRGPLAVHPGVRPTDARRAGRGRLHRRAQAIEEVGDGWFFLQI